MSATPRSWSRSLVLGAALALPWLAVGAGGSGALTAMDRFAAADTHRVYVANESSDMVSRVAFVPGAGALVEAEIPVGIMPADIDGAHGITVSPDGRFWYVTLAHGTPYGSVWQFHAGPDTLVGRTDLGLFPATMGVSPDGRFLTVVNFNLHGDLVPSHISVVYTPDMMEVARIETCLMPHGSRVNGSGTHQYSVCMRSDQLVALDLSRLSVSGRFTVTPGHEAAMAVDPSVDASPVKHAGVAAPAGAGAGEPGAPPSATRPPAGVAPCSPTWAEPGSGDGSDRVVYVACNKSAEVLEVDTDTWQVTRRFPTGAGPYNLDVTADGRVLVATLKSSQSLAVFDLQRGEELARLATTRPITHGVVISPDGRYAFVTNESVGGVRGTLDVFDLDALERVATVELGHQPGGIDYWGGPPSG